MLWIEVAGVLAAEELAEAIPACCLLLRALGYDVVLEEGDRFVGVAGCRAPEVLTVVEASTS